LSAVPTRNETGQITGAAVLFHDISQMKQLDEIRRDFVANVSHELRTPLSILGGYIETLMHDREFSEQEFDRILEVMKRHSDRLGALTEDLLSLARLESAHPNLKVENVRLSELFAAIVRDWGKRFAEHHLRIDVAVDATLPTIQADPTRLQEVLYNLLDNAVKYSRPNSKIRLQAVTLDRQVVVSVSDTGIGIPDADLPRIFERFYRADKARSREMGGTGLGLSIVKHIAELHGGRVQAESELGQGTTISVILPINGKKLEKG
jgi:two-component system phosphate regulon sensor histidine kinase PhoR